MATLFPDFAAQCATSANMHWLTFPGKGLHGPFVKPYLGGSNVLHLKPGPMVAHLQLLDEEQHKALSLL
jgi:hypothetical protein